MSHRLTKMLAHLWSHGLASRSPLAMSDRLRRKLASLEDRQRVCWEMAGVFLANRDAHGLMDIGAELQSLRIAILAVQGALDPARPAP